MGADFYPIAEEIREQTLEQSRAQLSESAFAAAWAEGEALSLEEAAEQAPELVAKLGDKVMIPHGLGAIGMKREQIGEMAELATSVKRLLDNSPVSFDKEALIGILEEAY